MLDDPVEVLEVGRRIVDVMDVEGVLVQRDDGRPLVHVHVLDAELLAELEAAIGVGVVEPPPLRGPVPLGGVELDAFDVVGLFHVVDVFERLLAVARIKGAVDDEPLGIALGDAGVALDGVEAVLVEVAKVGRVQDRDIVRPVDEQVVIKIVGAVLLELRLLPQLLLRAQVRVVGVEALDELLAVDVALVRRAPVPEVGVAVDDENLFALRRLEHEFLL